MPVWLMPAPLLAGSGIALFYDSGSIRDYCLFTGGAFATCLWFLHHHYWFLNIQIQTHGLRFLCQGILAALLPATLLPGLIIGRGSKTLVGVLMLAQVRSCASLCCAGLRCAALCCAVLCCAVPCCAVLCCTMPCCAVVCRASSGLLRLAHSSSSVAHLIICQNGHLAKATVKS